LLASTTLQQVCCCTVNQEIAAMADHSQNLTNVQAAPEYEGVSALPKPSKLIRIDNTRFKEVYNLALLI
jgi:hypothetical protein